MFNESSQNLIFDLEPCIGDVIGAVGGGYWFNRGKRQNNLPQSKNYSLLCPKIAKVCHFCEPADKEYDFSLMLSSVGCVITTRNGEKLSETGLRDGLYIAPDYSQPIDNQSISTFIMPNYQQWKACQWTFYIIRDLSI